MAAQIVPIIASIGQHTEIETRFILRDDHEDLIDLHLTNGARAIPKMIVLNKSFEVVSSWGPRPAEVQSMVMEYKHKPEPKEPYSEFQKKVQLWYAKDKYQSIQKEIIKLMETLI